MKILYITSSVEDYLSDSLLIGLKSLYGADVVDYPKSEILYNNCSSQVKQQVRGEGFTLYTGLLDDLEVDRFKIVEKVQKRIYDLVIFSDIWRQYGTFLQLRPWLAPETTIIIDGTDSPQTYPHAGLWWRRPYSWCLPRSISNFLYFKREWTPDSQFNLWHRCIPQLLRQYLPTHTNLRQISFSIPEEKIVKELPRKTKGFAVHCVDAEVAALVPGLQTSYAFEDEAAYYADLQASRFAVTTKRAGWDCLRHYEIAANGCIPCFRDLDKKPNTCAPHGLDTTNCVIYHSAEDLLEQLAELSADAIISLQAGVLKWVKQYSCKEVARNLLSQLQN